MHEAGLAASVADTLRRAGADGSDRTDRTVRLVVHGGHGSPDAFDAALRLHLASQLPDLGAAIEIRHAPHPTMCVACGAPFERLGDDPCPLCGGAGLPLATPETIDVEVEEGTPCA
jgi:Zn finger protein HypA/HybF involved in hydrogenase expression